MSAGRLKTECRECGQPLFSAVEMQSGWCRPCGMWEFRDEGRDELDIADDEAAA